MTRLHAVVPATVDDPTRPSGGNVYDRRLCAELGRLGRDVSVHRVPGDWPFAGPVDEARLAAALDAVPADEPVIVDGLVASAAPEVITRYAGRRCLVVLVHLPLGVASPELRATEGPMLRRASAVVATSAWTRRWLVDHEGLDAERVGVALPGTDPADLAPGSPTGGSLLCVGAVTPGKGYDVLLDALSRLPELPWRCVVAGSLEVDPAFAAETVARADGRVTFTGPLWGADLDAAYLDADVVVVPSRLETYGMVVTEALARGLPVIASAVGGVAESLGRAPDGRVPGLVVPPEDAGALAAALQTWLTDPDLRARLRRAAADRRCSLPTWSDTARRVDEVVRAVAGTAGRTNLALVVRDFVRPARDSQPGL